MVLPVKVLFAPNDKLPPIFVSALAPLTMPLSVSAPPRLNVVAALSVMALPSVAEPLLLIVTEGAVPPSVSALPLKLTPWPRKRS